jgi:hypothetical protein
MLPSEAITGGSVEWSAGLSLFHLVSKAGGDLAQDERPFRPKVEHDQCTTTDQPVQASGRAVVVDHQGDTVRGW